MFVLCMDPLIRHLIASVSPLSFVFAYMDDVTLVLADFFEEVPVVVVSFDLYAACTSMVLNRGECRIMPLMELDEANRGLAEQAVEFSAPGVQVVEAIKLLGVFLGPASLPLAWAKPAAKHLSRTEQVRSCNLGGMAALSLYNRQAFPTLTFPAPL